MCRVKGCGKKIATFLLPAKNRRIEGRNLLCFHRKNEKTLLRHALWTCQGVFQFVKLTQVKAQSVHSRLYFEVYRRCFPTWNSLLQHVQRAETVHRESDIVEAPCLRFRHPAATVPARFCHLFYDKRFLNAANGKTIGNVRQHADGTQQAVSVGIVFDDGAQFAVSYPFLKKLRF